MSTHIKNYGFIVADGFIHQSGYIYIYQCNVCRHYEQAVDRIGPQNILVAI